MKVPAGDYAVPLLMPGDFIISRKGRPFRYRHIPLWPGYAICYLVLALVKGGMGSGYPYPFLEIDKVGIQGVALNITGIALFFAALSSGLVYFNNKSR